MTIEDDVERVVELIQIFRDILTQCLARGMKPPLIMCAVNPDGGFMIMRVTPGHEPEVLVDSGMRFDRSFTIMAVDQDNEGWPNHLHDKAERSVPSTAPAPCQVRRRESHGPLQTDEEVAENQRVTLLGEQCEVTHRGMWDPAWDKAQ